MPALLTSTSTPPEGGFRGIEQATHIGGVAHVCLRCQGLTASLLDRTDQGFGRFRAFRVVDDDRETVAGQTLRNGSADTAGCAGDQGDFLILLAHEMSPDRPNAGVWRDSRLSLWMNNLC